MVKQSRIKQLRNKDIHPITLYKNMKRILTVIAFLFVSNLYAQKNEISKADSLRDEGNLELAIIEYGKLYRGNPKDDTNTYDFACALALDKQIDTAFYYLNLAVEKDTTIRPLTDPDFYFLIENNKWKDFQNKMIDRVEVKYGKYENLDLSKELWTMQLKDQAFYYHLEVAEKKSGRNSPIVSAIWELKHLINQKNIKRIQEIIKENGWPKKSVVKGSAAGTVFLVIQHADIEIQKKYLPLMTEAANNGEASWRSLALLIDRVNLGEGKRQIYGSQIGIEPKSGKFYVSPLVDPENVNKRRNEVGLGKIEDYVKHWNITWDIKKHKEMTEKLEKSLNR